MDKERLEVIEKYIKYRRGQITDDIRWLLSTVEEQQKEIERLKQLMNYARCSDCGNQGIEVLVDYTALCDMCAEEFEGEST